MALAEPERFSLDSNVFDRIVESDESLARVQRFVAAGMIEIVVTHVQEDELAQISDETKRARIAQVPRSCVPTSHFVLDFSRLGMARLGESPALDILRDGNWTKYTKDGLIAATAELEGITLVTEERRLANRAREDLGMDVWDWARLDAHLRSLDQPSG